MISCKMFCVAQYLLDPTCALLLLVATTLCSMSFTHKDKIALMKSMGANKFQILLKLVVPSSLPTFISMLKISVGMAWVGSIMGEYLVSKQGIGYLIVYGGQVFKLDLVMTSVIILAFLRGRNSFGQIFYRKHQKRCYYRSRW